MTQPAAVQQPQTQPTGYEVAVAALVVAGVLAANAAFDRLVPDGTLVEELPPLTLDLLRRTIALLVVRSNDRARALADLAVAAVRTRILVPDARHVAVAPRGTVAPPGEVERLDRAAETLLQRAADMSAERDRIAALDRAIAGAQAEVDRIDAAAEAERVAALARAEAELARLDAADRAAEIAREREQIAERARERRARAEQRRSDSIERRAEARAARRQAQRARVERLARAEPYQAGAQTIATAASETPEVLGWTRKLTGTSCPICLEWWDGHVRPYSVAMKRHPGCDCVQRPVYSREEANARPHTDAREPVYRRPARDTGSDT